MIPVVAAEYKLVLVGDSAVGTFSPNIGKSSLLCQFVDNKFDDQLLSTIGVDFKFRRVKIGNEEVKLQVWDTAGNGFISKVKRHSDPLSVHITTAQMPFCFVMIFQTISASR